MDLRNAVRLLRRETQPRPETSCYRTFNHTEVTFSLGAGSFKFTNEMAEFWQQSPRNGKIFQSELLVQNYKKGAILRY